jgi:hypothetical protein
MNQVERPRVQWHVTVIFDWKMAAVLSLTVLIRLLIK